nr:ribonuclease H-like domain-containing protein [Tanacetum cinerariifolium]
MPPRADLSSAGLDDSVFKSQVSETITSVSKIKTNASKTSKDSLEKPKTIRSSAHIIEDWESDSEDENVFESKEVKKTVKPSLEKIKFVNARNTNVKNENKAENPRNLNKVWKVPVNTAKQSSQRAATSVSAARHVNTAASIPNVNSALPTTYSYFKAHSPVRRLFNQKSAAKTNSFNEKVNTVKVNNVTTAGPKAVVSAAERNKNNDQGIFDKESSRHMTRKKSYLTYYQDIDGGFVAFGENAKGGKITRKGKIRTGKLDFKDVYFVKELKFILFSVSQMCDKKNSVFFTDTECVVLSSDFKLLDESQILLKVPRNNNMYSFDLKNVVPVGGLTCLFAKSALDESNLWYRRLGRINFKTMNKLMRGNHARGIENQMDHKVKAIRCDNRTEFKNRIMNEFYKMKGYSINSKAFRVFNTRTKIVEESMHLTFLENKLNVAAMGPNWMFDIDTLTMCMNYKPVFARNQTNGLKSSEDEVADDAGKKAVNTNRTNILHTVSSAVNVVSSSFTTVDLERERAQRNEFKSMIGQDKDDNGNRIFTPISVARSTYVYLGGSIPVNVATLLNVDLSIDPLMPDLEDTVDTIIFSGVYNDEVEGAKANFNNLELTIVFSPIPTTRIHKDHPKEQIIGDLLSRLLDLPNGKHAIGTKYVYRSKKDERGIVVRNKARLVAQSYTQEEGIDYDEVFALVARIEAIWLFLVYALFMRFQVTPKISHLHTVKRIFRYLKGQPKLCLWYPRGSPFNLEAFSDSDYVGASLDKKSTTGGCQFLGKRLISWQCKKQTVVAKSTTEAEYVADANYYGQSFSGIITPLFETMMVQALEEVGEGSELPTDTHHTAIVTQPSSSQPQKKQKSRRKQRHETEIPHTEPQTEKSVPTTSNDPLPSGDDRMQLTELMNLYTNLQKQVLDLEKAKTAQAKEIADLKKVVKKLERRKKSRTSRECIQTGRIIDNIDQDEEIALVDETQGMMNEEEMFRVNDLDGDEVIVDATSGEEVEHMIKVTLKEVSTADPVTTACEVITTAEDVEVTTAVTTPQISKDELTLAQTLIEIKAAKPEAKWAKDKGKGIMVEPEKPLKKKDLIAFDEELQTEEQEQLTDAEKARLLMELLEKRRKFFARKREIEKRNIPPTKAQQRNLMCTYLKNMDGWNPKNLKKSSKRAGDQLEQESAKRQMLEKDDDSTELKRCLEIVSEDDDDAEEGPNYALMAFLSLSSDSKIVDNCKKRLGYEIYNAVPPPYTGNFQPPTPDLSFTSLDEFVNKHVAENCKAKSSKKEPKTMEEIDEGYVAFGGNPKGGKIIENGTIRTEAVNTACYVQNRVLVVKPYNKTPYELFYGKTSALSSMRPFGCPITILNTIDHLDKFDGKADEDFFVEYSLNSKGFRVLNSKTRIVEENLHIKFSESTPNIIGSGPDWLFDIDALTRTMNYESIVVGTHSNDYADLKSSHDDGSNPSSDDGKKVDEDPRKENECKDQEKEVNVNNTNNVNTVSLIVNVVGTNEDNELLFDPNMPALEDVSIFNFSNDDEDDGPVADMDNLDTTIQVSPIPTTRIHKDHPLDPVIEYFQLAIQTRKMSKNLGKHGFEEPKVKTANTPMKTQKPLLNNEDGEEVDVHMYLKGQPKLGHWYPRDSSFDLVVYTDSDYVGASLDKKSTIGGCQFFGCRLISWQCKKQIVVANSIIEAAYVPQPSGPTESVADEAVHKELGDSLVRAATTACSLEA